MKFFTRLSNVVISGLFFLCFGCTENSLQKNAITIKVDKDSIPMGRSVILTAHLNLKPGELAKDYLLLPFVNQRRWGSHERPDSSGNATFLLPLPNQGKSEIQVIAIKAESGNWMGISDRKLLLAGNLMPDTCRKSNEISVLVKKAYNAGTN